MQSLYKKEIWNCIQPPKSSNQRYISDIINYFSTIDSPAPWFITLLGYPTNKRYPLTSIIILVKIWEFPSLTLSLKKGNSHLVCIKIVKNLRNSHFCTKQITIFWNSHVFLTLVTTKVINFLKNPTKNVVKIVVIPMSSWGGVCLISVIAY